MTAAQKAARVKFNKAIAIRKKTGCTLKQAFAQVYGKKVGAVKKKAAPKKKVAKKVVKKAAPKKKKISEKAILNKIHRVKKSVDVLDEAQHKHMLGGKLSLPQQLGKIKMGSIFIYYKGYSIEKMLLSIKDKKKKTPIFIVHEFGDTYKTLAAAKAAINFLGR